MLTARKKTTNHGPTLVGRYEQVIGTLLKFGYADILAHPPLNRFVSKSKKFIPQHKGKPVTDYTRYERIRFENEELGTTFVKFAQVVCLHRDWFGQSCEMANFDPQQNQL